MTTYNDARQLVKDRALSKYHFRAAKLLERLVGCAYSETQPGRDIESITFDRTVVCIRGWLAGVSDRQLRRIFDEIDEVKVTRRAKGKIFFILDMTPLRDAEKITKLSKNITKERLADRATKARERYAEQRKATRLTDAAKAIRENKERFFDVVLRPETRRKHASLPLRAEAPSVPVSVNSAETEP
jgi:phage-related minor tail protein